MEARIRAKSCRSCHTKMPANSTVCPYCYKLQWSAIATRALVVLLVVLAVAGYLKWRAGPAETGTEFKEAEKPYSEESFDSRFPGGPPEEASPLWESMPGREEPAETGRMEPAADEKEKAGTPFPRDLRAEPEPEKTTARKPARPAPRPVPESSKPEPAKPEPVLEKKPSRAPEPEGPVVEKTESPRTDDKATSPAPPQESKTPETTGTPGTEPEAGIANSPQGDDGQLPQR